MVHLSRTVRFAVNPAADPPESHKPSGRNGFAGVPAIRGLGRHYEITITCAGDLDPATGYLMDIKEIDRAVRETLVPRIAQACSDSPHTEPGELAPSLLTLIDRALAGAVASLVWRLTPYYSVQMQKTDPGAVLLRQRFDFSAAHRLHSPALSDDENRRRFGKCNNPSGHGHNYQVEPCIAVRLGPPGSARQSFVLADLERLVDETIIKRFDHKHLNIDTPEFSSPGGLIPTVENIAKVCYDLLAPTIRAAAGSSASLESITVWETDKTSCTYPGS
jgi:6-pyruvoyltetrahydropterin/6-carboxytetrahydropterin synthase